MTPEVFLPAEMRLEADNCEHNCGCDRVDSLPPHCSHSRRAAMLRQAANADARWAELKAWHIAEGNKPATRGGAKQLRHATSLAEMARIEGARA